MTSCRNVRCPHSPGFQALLLQPTEGHQSLCLQLGGVGTGAVLFCDTEGSLHWLPGKEPTLHLQGGMWKLALVNTKILPHFSPFQNLAVELKLFVA